MTVSEALRHAEHRLREAGVPEPALDAELLLRHVLGWDRAAVIARRADTVPAAEEKTLFALVDERAARRPLQHVTGTQAFWRHEFLVTPDVLVPRPETEILVEAALELMRGLEAPVVVDVGTGSGCIALSIAAERPDAEVHAVDISAAALAVVRENARRLGQTRVELHEGDLLEPVAHLGGKVDIVVSNPPYVDPGELPSLAPEVRDHEPRQALLAPDGRPYGIYGRLADASCRLLRPGGHLLAEVGRGMAETVAETFRAAGLSGIQTRADLAGIPRVVSGHRP